MTVKDDRWDKNVTWQIIGDAVLLFDGERMNYVTDKMEHSVSMCIMDDKFAELVSEWVKRRSRYS